VASGVRPEKNEETGEEGGLTEYIGSIILHKIHKYYVDLTTHF